MAYGFSSSSFSTKKAGGMSVSHSSRGVAGRIRGILSFLYYLIFTLLLLFVFYITLGCLLLGVLDGELNLRTLGE
jgi:hypothetical protein